MMATWRIAVSIVTIIGLIGSHAACDDTEIAVAQYHVQRADRPVERLEFQSGSQLEQLIKDLDDTAEAWQAGRPEVPRVFITAIPSDWSRKPSQKSDVVSQKRVFIRLLNPLILLSNELITAQRNHVEAIAVELRAGAEISPEDQTLLQEIARAYKVLDAGTERLDWELLDTLLRRVDTLPPSLVLAQAAIESGWGTSRFAVEGNALFGMWTWGGKGIKPLHQRAGLGNYKIAAYETPLHSVIAYMHNLNTHRAYRDLRARRAELRKTGAKVSGWDLAKTLSKYSERGLAYVNSLQSLMKGNQLHMNDDACLADGPTILLEPVKISAN